ncbi:MAG: phosphotransferase enzyme family protein [Chloroflexota bacterium]
MHEPPANLPAEALREHVQAAYGLSVSEVRFLPLGHDPAAWVYRVRTASGEDLFLKVHLRIRNQAGLLAPRHLRSAGIQQVVAPRRTHNGTLWTETHGYTVVLYPFVEGQNGFQQRLSPSQWEAFGRVLRRVHDTPFTPSLGLAIEQDSFTPAGADLIRQLDAEIGERTFTDEAHQALAQSWQTQRATILMLVEWAEELGERLANAFPLSVICHADIHTGNVLVGTDGRIWIVDWDEVTLAPRERDLMFAVGGISRQLVSPSEAELFLRGYCDGRETPGLDPLALAYYRYAWAVSDLSAFAETVLHRADLSVLLRLSEAAMFQRLFAPGEIVEIALSSPVEAT